MPLDVDVRIVGMGFEFPGEAIPLRELTQDPEAIRRLEASGQEFTFRSVEDSTGLAIEAARAALADAGAAPESIGLVITAPSLITSYGLEIPAVAVRARLGLRRAQCLSVVQGCTGVFAAMRIAAERLRSDPDTGAVLVATGCKASTLMEGFHHGAFFWADAGAALVLSKGSRSAPSVRAYAEANSDANWGAMRIPFGDGHPAGPDSPPDHFRIGVSFPSRRDQVEYIAGERRRFQEVLDALLAAAGLEERDLSALLLPSTGRNRLSVLLEGRPQLESRIATDFRYPHMGAVDVLHFLRGILDREDRDDPAWIALLSPAFSAQWAGVLVRTEATHVQS